MSKRKAQQVVFPLASEDEFLKAIEDSSKFLTVRLGPGPCAPARHCRSCCASAPASLP